MAEKTCSFSSVVNDEYFRYKGTFYQKTGDTAALMVEFAFEGLLLRKVRTFKPELTVEKSSESEVLTAARQRHRATVEDGGFSPTIAAIVILILGAFGLLLWISTWPTPSGK